MKPILFTPTAEAQLKEWSATNKKIYNRIIDILQAIQTNPFKGIGKPEPLKYQMKGCWSRRICEADRLVYPVTKESIIVISCRFHY